MQKKKLKRALAFVNATARELFQVYENPSRAKVEADSNARELFYAIAREGGNYLDGMSIHIISFNKMHFTIGCGYRFKDGTHMVLTKTKANLYHDTFTPEEWGEVLHIAFNE